MTLTDLDLRALADARTLTSLQDPDAVTGHTRHTDLAMAYSAAFGQAQYVLRELTALTERLEADVARLRNDRARYRTQLALPPDYDDQEALREAGQPGRLAPE
jgi:hypothetical protein